MTDMQVEKGIVALDEKLGAETTRLDDISKNLVEARWRPVQCVHASSARTIRSTWPRCSASARWPAR